MSNLAAAHADVDYVAIIVRDNNNRDNFYSYQMASMADALAEVFDSGEFDVIDAQPAYDDENGVYYVTTLDNRTRIEILPC